VSENKFKRMLDTARNQPEVEDSYPEPQTELTDSKRGRPATGKRSNPEYASTTIFLKKSTKKAAAKILINEQVDLSDVLESLLSEWINSRL
jgi:hypothetical protein